MKRRLFASLLTLSMLLTLLPAPALSQGAPASAAPDGGGQALAMEEVSQPPWLEGGAPAPDPTEPAETAPAVPEPSQPIESEPAAPADGQPSSPEPALPDEDAPAPDPTGPAEEPPDPEGSSDPEDTPPVEGQPAEGDTITRPEVVEEPEPPLAEELPEGEAPPDPQPDQDPTLESFSHVVYLSCDVQINTTAGKTVNLYTNLGDSSRAAYFNKGQTAYSTYKALPSDGSVWYKIRANHLGNPTDFWLNAASAGVTIIDRTPARVSFTASSMTLDVGDTYDMTLQFQGGNLARMRYGINDDSICTAEWGDVDWRAGTGCLHITGRRAGSTRVTVTLYNEADESLYTNGFTVTVRGRSYSLYYSANGGTGAPSSQYGSTLTVSNDVPERFKYDFLGWSTSSSASSPSYYPGNSITLSGSTTLYAVWQYGTYISLSSLPRTTSVNMNVADAPRYLRFSPSRSGTYTFESTGDTDTIGTLYNNAGEQLQRDDDGGEGRNFRVTYYLDSSTLYALKVSLYSSTAKPGYISIKASETTRTLHYNANGGTGAPSDQTGSSLTVSDSVPTWFGYNFLGWAASSSASSPDYLPGASITLGSDTTLYAVWQSALYRSMSSLPRTTSVNMDIAGAARYIALSPSTSGRYVFESSGSNDTIGTLYDTSGRELKKDDDSGTGRNFKLTYSMTGGSDYYLKVSLYSSSAKPGNISITIDRDACTLSFDANSGSGAPQSVTVEGSQTLTLPTTVPTRFGYNFLGWGTSSSASSPDYYPGNSITLSSSMTLYAVWQNGIYTGLTSLPRTTNVNMNIAGAVRYLRFCPSNAGRYVFQSTSDQDTIGTLYDSSGTRLARDDDGGTDRNFKITYDLAKGSYYYLMVSLYSSVAKPGLIPITIDHDVCTLRFDANGGSGAPDSMTGSQLTLPSTIPAKFGYNFKGWGTSASDSTPDYYPGDPFTLTSSTTLYAVWGDLAWYLDPQDQQAYITTLNMDIAGAPRYIALLPSSSGRCTIESTGSEDTIGTLYSASGSQIARDDDGGENRNFRLTLQMEAGATYYLKMTMYSSSARPGDIIIKFSPATATLRYDADGGTGAPANQTGTSVTVSTQVPSKFGYDFGGWSRLRGSSQPDHMPGASVTLDQDMTLYAVWKAPHTSTIESLPEISLLDMNIAGAPRYICLAPARSGQYTFQTAGSNDTVGTLYDASGSQLASDDDSGELLNYKLSYNLEGGVKYYLKTSLYRSSASPAMVPVTITEESYTLRFSANGGSGAPESIQGGTMTLPATVPAQFGFDFLGWSKSSGASSAEYRPGGTITLSEDTTLYAVWRAAQALPASFTSYRTSVSMEVAGAPRYLSFTPSATGKYVIQSTGSYDTIGYLYDASENLLTINDDDGDGSNFMVEQELSAGLTYYLRITVLGGAVVSQPIDILAKKTIAAYTITFDPNGEGGTVEPATKRVSNDGTYGVLPVPQRPGYTFEGWFTEATGGTQVTSTTPVEGRDRTLYAHWTMQQRAPFDVTKDAYRFVNAAASFGYTSTGRGDNYPIPYSSVYYLFGDDLRGDRIYNERMITSDWSGNCCGMAASSALMYDGLTAKEQDFGSNYVSDLTIAQKNSVLGGLDVKTFIEVMQISQYVASFAKARQESQTYKYQLRGGRDLNALRDAVRQDTDSGKATVIAIGKEGQGGHALLAYGITESGSSLSLKIYDCNTPLRERTLSMTMEGNKVKGWSYDMGGSYGVWSSEDDYCWISFVPYNVIETIWKNRGHQATDMELLTLGTQDVSIKNGAGQVVATVVNGKITSCAPGVCEVPNLTLQETSSIALYLPKGYYTVTADDPNQQLQATMADSLNASTIETSASKVAFAVDANRGSNSVSILESKPEDSYKVSMTSGPTAKNVTAEGTATLGGVIGFTGMQENIGISGSYTLGSKLVDGVEQVTHYISADIVGGGGTISPKGDTAVLAGNTMTYTFAPDAGYVVQDVMVDGESLGRAVEYTFSNVKKSHTIKVRFEPAHFDIVGGVLTGSTVKATVQANGQATIVAAVYSSEGVLQNTSIQTVAKSNDVYDVYFRFDDAPPPKDGKIKLFMMDGNYRPLCQPYWVQH